MLVIGLTGPTGSGKSFAARVFQEKGYRVIDADRVSRNCVRKGTECLAELVGAFGAGILDHDGGLNRKALARLAFSDKSRTERLNSVTHPYIIREIESEIRSYERQGARAVLLDAPALFESGAQKICDKVVVVMADENTRYERILARDGITPEEAHRRMSAQNPPDYYLSRADFVLWNNGDFSGFRCEAAGLAEKLAEQWRGAP